MHRSFAPCSGCELDKFVCKKMINFLINPLHIHNSATFESALCSLKQRLKLTLFVVHRIIQQ
jgi:Mn-containing catalase